MDNLAIYEYIKQRDPYAINKNALPITFLSSNESNSEGTVSNTHKDVNFLDYDGTIVYSYDKKDFLKLTTMPKNPVHKGLISQGWNFTLEDALNHVQEYDRLNIGQMYTTDDNKTRFYISLYDGRLSPQLSLAMSGSAVIDWGDGSPKNTIIGSGIDKLVSQDHEYLTKGDYVITLDISGNVVFRVFPYVGRSGFSPNYTSFVTKIELGNNVHLDYQAFDGYDNLETITIPQDVDIGQGAFTGCRSLKSLTIPVAVNGILANAIMTCTSLSSISIPQSVQFIGYYAMAQCSSLTDLTLPSNIDFVQEHDLSGIFLQNGSLSSITLPKSITRIPSKAFQTCVRLGFIKFTSSTPPTVSDINAWEDIPTDCIIYVPRGSLSAYVNAENYPSNDVYTYIEY